MREVRHDEFPPLANSAVNAGNSTSYAALANELQASGINGKYTQFAKELHEAVVHNRRAKPKKEPVVGSSTSNKHVSSVTTTRVVDMFVSRLHPHTANSDVEDCVKTIAGKDINIVEVRCNKLKSRYEHLYSFVHVEIVVTAADLKQAIGSFMKTESWPVGIFVKRYFKPKNGNGES